MRLNFHCATGTETKKFIYHIRTGTVDCEFGISVMIRISDSVAIDV